MTAGVAGWDKFYPKGKARRPGAKGKVLSTLQL